MSVMLQPSAREELFRRAAHQQRQQQQRAFKTIFARRQHEQATPSTSPITNKHQSFAEAPDEQSDLFAENLQQYETAWSIATRWLSASSVQDPPQASLDQALDIVFARSGSGDKDVLTLHHWFAREVEQQVHGRVEPLLRNVANTTGRASSRLNSILSTCRDNKDFLLGPLTAWLAMDANRTIISDASLARTQEVQHLLDKATIAYIGAIRKSIDETQYISLLTAVLTDILKIMTDGRGTSSDMYAELQQLSELGPVGMGGEPAQVSLAYAVHDLIDYRVNGADMKVDWMTCKSRAPELRDWVQHHLQPSVTDCLRAITGNARLEVPASDCDRWQRIALGALGRSRLQHLLNYVQLWPESLGAILDLKDYTALADAKQHLAVTFMEQMEDRVGHAGITTAELLGIYVAVIRVFKTLDNRSVLLEKVSQPLRRYLRDRQDTVKVIAASFLADVDDKGEPLASGADVGDICGEVAREVRLSEHTTQQPSQSLDWDDMSWLPDPIDAGPDYRSTKSNDIISYMLSLFDKDSFIKEVQNILGERLLRSDSTKLETEDRLVEMLKSRLGADKLQSAEVMVKDMTDSARLMKLVRSTNSKLPRADEIYDVIPDEGITLKDLVAKLGLPGAASNELKARYFTAVRKATIFGLGEQEDLLFRDPAFVPSADFDRFDAKILSSFFWPELRDDSFKVPLAIERAQKQYESDFRRFKPIRKLQWFSALGHADVELELKDRSVKVEGVKTWVAAVIYAFENPEPAEDAMDVDMPPARRSVAELEEQLNMDEVLVRNAISFWLGQRVLQEVQTDVYEVLETLPDESEQAAQPVFVPQEETVSALKSQSAVLKENKPMYESFMIGMLTNGGAMDAGRIAMMLKMVVPGGFNFGEEEVTWLLEGLQTDGKVEMRGNTWVIKK